MKSLRNVLGLHFTTLLMFGVMFPLLIWGIGKLFPAQANGFPIYRDGKLIGFANIGQKFTEDKYFWGRPSAVDYNAASTGASNYGPTNPAYLDTVEHRIEVFMKRNPGIKRDQIPSDLVTASGSGIDPDISVRGALIQIPRVANARGISQDKLKMLVEQHIGKPLLGLFGPEKVDILELNLALDKMEKN
jgi:potassium-transporting ATPase KdpC subunit